VRIWVNDRDERSLAPPGRHIVVVSVVEGVVVVEEVEEAGVEEERREREDGRLSDDLLGHFGRALRSFSSRIRYSLWGAGTGIFPPWPSF
jgi:hypothetical protein